MAESVILLHKQENTFSLHYEKKTPLSLKSSSLRPCLQVLIIFNSGSSHTAIRFNFMIFCRIWLLHIQLDPKEFSCAIGRCSQHKYFQQLNFFWQPFQPRPRGSAFAAAVTSLSCMINSQWKSIESWDCTEAEALDRKLMETTLLHTQYLPN